MRAKIPEIARLVRQALDEDVGAGDLTTRMVVPAARLAVGTIRAKESMILAGVPLAREVFRQVDPTLRFDALREEGKRVGRGAPVARIRGRAASILTGERTALNFLQHLSGIATYTARCLTAARGRCRVRDTRKTHPGLREIEKYAVRLAGGQNHRFGLDDGILIKHNHWRVAGGVKASVERARRMQRRRISLPIQVEVSTLADLREALEAGADSVLLDNLSPRRIRRALDLIHGRIPVELSGGITRSSMARFASFRPDFISLGALTHSSGWVDLSLHLEGAGK